MALYSEGVEEVQGGIVKRIDESAMPLVFDILQRHQYQYPVKSTVRELVSNALDSNTEKHTALEILRGAAKVEDYYEERAGDMYKDSRFDPSYYDPKWLNPENKVTISYNVFGDMEKDTVTVEDTGVGLGSYRLRKYFDLGYSTKRLSKLPLGKYGIGNKSPLSLNPYYTVESRYNGQLFRLNVYSSNVESIIPPLNLITGEANPFILFDEGLPSEKKIYYLPTEELNGVKITLEAKKHYRPKYEEAVKEQLLYFKDVDFVIRDHTQGTDTPVYFKADILFEDDFIVLAKQKYFNKPHILLNRVNYGYIDFQELELQDIRGSIGIKVAPENVEVTPSREALVWSDVTKSMILQRFKDVQKSASILVEKELSTETDFLKWLKLCHQLTCSWGDNTDTLLGRLSHLVELKEVDFKFRLERRTVKYMTKMFDAFKPREISLTSKRSGAKMIEKIARNSVKGAMPLFLPLFFATKTTASNRKDKYITHTQGNFVVIYRPYFMDPDAEIPEDPEEIITLDVVRKEIADIWNALIASPEIQDYTNLEVPDSFTGTEDDEEEAEEERTVEEQKAAVLSAEERRKLSGKTLVFTPRVTRPGTTIQDPTPGASQWDRKDVHHQWQKMEIQSSEIDTWEEPEIYYGSEEDSKLLYFVTYLTQDSRLKKIHDARPLLDHGDLYKFMSSELDNSQLGEYLVSREEAARCTHFFKPAMGVKLIKVSKTNTKLYKDFQHISKFFAQYKNKQITVSPFLLRWNTARIIKKDLHKLNFMFGLSGYNAEKEGAYSVICKYVEKYSTDYDRLPADILKEFSEPYQSLIEHLTKLQNFQEFVTSGASSEDISEAAKQTFGSSDVTSALAVETDILEIFKTLLEWAEPVCTLLNEIPCLTGKVESHLQYQIATHNKREAQTINSELEQKIISYLQDKNVS